ncbi:recombinase RecT [Sediminibacillus massiliensis]|uniref:recombinase RecT n=1 Tax=Sediminibacillus massiliensis TaxID=1926277 RepID=UPI000988583A|nr:recombinase RecT [Sediminibacillus massiliensis]
MATNSSLKNQISNRKNNAPSNGQGTTMKGLLNSPAVMKRFEEVLGKRANQFTASILSLYNSEKMLQKAEPMSVISSAMIAATLDLPVDKNLGYAWIVPYSGKAQFQLGYKGYIQLALRTGQYRNINVIEVYEGELLKWNRLTEEIELDFDEKQSDKVIGYTGYFELINGFRKTVYWSKADVEKHKKKFSKSDFGWKNDWDAMAKKTVIRNMLNKWGILSIDMQKAFADDDKAPIDIDNENEEVDEDIIDGEFSEVDEPGEEELKQAEDLFNSAESEGN